MNPRALWNCALRPLLSSLLFGMAAAVPVHAGSAPGLVAGYGFEEGTGATTADSSGNQLTGALRNATWVANGKFGKALSFNGSSSWVTVPDSSVLDLTSGMTLSAWVKLTQATTWPCVVMKERAGELTYAMYANSDTNQPNINFTSSGQEVNLNAGNKLSTNTWTYLTGTFDGSTLKFYVNGALKGSLAANRVIDTTTGVLRIGGNSVWPGEFLKGVIDEVRVYNRALSESEILADMGAPVVDTVPDTAPPTGSVTINGGVSSTNNAAVNLALSASDASGVSQMRFSNDGAAFSAPEAYATTKAWVLASGDGPKTVFAQFKDSVGNWSSSVSSGILLDTAAPVPSAPSVSSITSVSAVIAWTTDEPARAAVDYGLTASYGQSVSSSALTTGQSLTLSGLSAATTYHYRARSADAAGNFSESADATFTTGAPADTVPPTVSLASPSAGAVVSGSVPVSAEASDDVGVVGVRFLLDGAQVGAEQTAPPYAVAWDTSTVANGTHALMAVARDAAGNSTTSAAVAVTVSNAGAPPPNGLVAAYGFEEGAGAAAADASANHLTGAVSNAAWITDGKFGKALSFSGSSGSWVTVPDADALDLTSGMTVSAWVKPSAALPQWPCVLMKERAGELTYALYANSNTGQPNINYTSGGAEVNLNAGSAVPPNVWTHLAGTFDGSTLRLYINGQLVGTQATTQSIDVTGGVLRIGGDSVWPGESFPGAIDEVRIYNRALSQSEIQADLDAPIVNGGGGDVTSPTIALDSPSSGAAVKGNVLLTASAADDVGVAGVKFFVDGAQIGAEVASPPFALFWDSTGIADGSHAMTAVARDAAGNSATSAALAVSVSNANAPAYPVAHLSPGNRYLVDPSGAPVLIHGDAPWSLISNMTNEDVDDYLEARRSQGFNALIVNLLEHKFTANAPMNIYGAAPFTVPGDFSTPNEAYFAHADLVLQKAAAKGFLVFLAPAYLGFGGGDEGWYQEMIASGAAKLQSYGAFLGNRYKDYGNIVWLEGGDFNPPDKSLTNAVVSGIKAFDANHLHTAHCNAGSSPIDVWGSEGWFDFSNVYTYPTSVNVVPVYQKALAERSRVDWKPFLLLESTYEGEHDAPQTLIRQQSYEALLSGGMGDFYGNSPVWLFGAGWEGALGSRGALDMFNVRLFFGLRHWEKLVPDSAHAFVTAGFSSGAGYAAAARAADGSWGAVYIPTARTITVSLSGFAGSMQARWYDPTNGTYSAVAGSPFANSGSANIATPGPNATGTSDWVLVFDPAP